jgi:hypothetical protein
MSRIAACIGCSCDDRHACEGGCWWLRLDRTEGIGVCSQCEEHIEAWDRGDRTSRCETEAEIERHNAQEIADVDAANLKRPHDCTAGDHVWNNGGCNPTHCLDCGMSIWRHAFMECP